MSRTSKRAADRATIKALPDIRAIDWLVGDAKVITTSLFHATAC